MDKFSNSLKIVMAHCAVNLALDIWMLILPMTQLYNIGLKINKRINVMAMFGRGIFYWLTLKKRKRANSK
ncbi:hypothetical protein J7337_012270 [Fusarium musae]|uniref:Rhodopsin domain-containing protein n=1 Tax=Fusarium musae TaxID=1042133 RepID=A0A9P8IK21_9HYPO|nr:hypothetical protein J7337_012270 [Fusarium musae]KAG9495713.1 hypothetical protein J7337_012270 [Fusarium musae]